MRALSTRNSEPERASRPFEKDREGFVIAEGAGLLVLEELEHAQKRGAPIHAEIIGFGCNGDAYHISAPSPNGIGAARCMEVAMKDAKIDYTDVDYINAHGTSTPLNDAMETLAIIAYKQPIIRSEIEHIRGVDSGGVLRLLLERKLVRILGRKEIPGRPLIYATTKQFLEVFELKDLKDLPTPKEIEELSKSHLEDELVIEGSPEVAVPAPDPLQETPENGFDAEIEGDHQET